MQIRRVGLGVVSVCLLSGPLTGCEKQVQEAPRASASAAAGGQIQSMRAGWKKRWAQFPALPACPEVGAEGEKLCRAAVETRDALKQGELKDVSNAEHLSLAAAAAEAAAAAGAKLELTYLQRLVLRGQSEPPASGAPSGSVKPPSAPSAQPSSAQAPSAAPAGSGDEHQSPAGSIKRVIEDAKHGHAVERDPLQLASLQYFNAERDALLRVAGYIREGNAADRESAVQLFEKHAMRHTKSLRAQQLLNEAIILVSDKELRERLRVIRRKMGPGAVPAPSAS